MGRFLRPSAHVKALVGAALAVGAALVLCAQPATPTAPVQPAPVVAPGLRLVHASTSQTVSETSAASMTQAEEDFTASVFRIVNRRRHQHGLRRVRWNRCVTGFSDQWASYLVGHDLYEHSDLSNLLSRCASPYVEENIAQLSTGATPRLLVKLWMHSPEHRKNILNKAVTAGGLSVRWDADRKLWIAVQNFAERPGSLSRG